VGELVPGGVQRRRGRTDAACTHDHGIRADRRDLATRALRSHRRSALAGPRGERGEVARRGRKRRRVSPGNVEPCASFARHRARQGAFSSRRELRSRPRCNGRRSDRRRGKDPRRRRDPVHRRGDRPARCGIRLSREQVLHRARKHGGTVHRVRLLRLELHRRGAGPHGAVATLWIVRGRELRMVDVRQGEEGMHDQPESGPRLRR